MADTPFDIQLIDAMARAEFVDFCQQLLENAGFEVIEPEGNYGAHFLIRDSENKRAAVRCYQSHRRKVNRPFVKAAVNAQGHYQCDYSMIIANQELSPRSRTIALQCHVVVWDRLYIEDIGPTMERRLAREDQPAQIIDLMDEKTRQVVDEVRPLTEGELSDVEVELLDESRKLLEELDETQRKNKLSTEYWDPFDHDAPTGEDNMGPYGWQIELHNAGSHAPERCLIAANRIGKTHWGAAETSIHMTGVYPPWWEGRRFKEPVRVCVGSDTNETSREIVQMALMGEPRGTGWLPAEKIVDCTYRQAGIPDVVDTVTVRHVSGRTSRLVFKTYEQGRKKWQGTSQHIVWFDEEPPEDIFTEGLTRTMDVDGLIYMTFTPLNGASSVVSHFLDGGPGIFSFNATWDDAPHLGEDEKRRLEQSYPQHEREVRSRGIPIVGSGLIYPTPDEEIEIEPFEIPDYFRKIVGIDFGIDHPFAAVWVAYDADEDVVYVYDCYKTSGQTAAYHADCIGARGDWIPVAWPHDGMHRDKGSGIPLADQYRHKGVNMLQLSARYRNDKGGAVGREPIVQEIDDRMRSGRFKVFGHLHAWFREKRMYHRRDGMIQAENDDIMSATNYAVMMVRFARTLQKRKLQTTAAPYDPFERLSR
jgi:phage terminase large subunit-like protein